MAEGAAKRAQSLHRRHPRLAVTAALLPGCSWRHRELVVDDVEIVRCCVCVCVVCVVVVEEVVVVGMCEEVVRARARLHSKEGARNNAKPTLTLPGHAVWQALRAGWSCRRPEEHEGGHGRLRHVFAGR